MKESFFSPDLFKHYSQANLSELESLLVNTSLITYVHEKMLIPDRKETTVYHTEVREKEFSNQNQL